MDAAWATGLHHNWTLSLGNLWFFWQISKHVCSLSKAGQSHYLISQPWETNLKNSIAVRDLQSGTSNKIYKSATDPKSTLSPYTNVIQITSIHLLSFLFNLFLWHFSSAFLPISPTRIKNPKKAYLKKKLLQYSWFRACVSCCGTSEWISYNIHTQSF